MNYRDSDEKDRRKRQEEDRKKEDRRKMKNGGMGGVAFRLPSAGNTQRGGGIPAGQRSSRRKQLRHSLLYANADMIT